LLMSTVVVTVPCCISASSRALKYLSSSTKVNSFESSVIALRSISSISKLDIQATKVRKSEQNTKQKGKFFHFCLYFRTKVPSTNRSEVRKSEQNTKQKGKFFHFCLNFRTKVPSTKSEVRLFFQLNKFFCYFLFFCILIRTFVP